MTAITFEHSLFKAGYRDDQPRNPKGSPGGGRWTSAGGESAVARDKDRRLERESASMRRINDQLAAVRQQRIAEEAAKARHRAAEEAAKAAAEVIKKPTAQNISVWRNFVNKAIEVLKNPGEHFSWEGTAPFGAYSLNDPAWKKLLISTGNVVSAIGLGVGFGVLAESPGFGFSAAVIGIGLYVMHQYDKLADERLADIRRR